MNEVKIDALLSESDDVAAAIVLREYLMPVEGRDGVLFPPTFAAAENSREFPGGYNIDELGNGENVCLIDSVGSQANRLEPMFAESPHAGLVPQITIEAGSKRVNLLEAGHRAGDAIVRCTELKDELNGAFKSLRNGNAVPLARLAPTSLVFGVWDSRDTQAKAPRLIASTIRAFNVAKLTRSAQYNPAVEYVEEKLLEDTDDKDALNAYSERGFQHVPASHTHGGVIAKGDIRRERTLQLAALRLLRGESEEDTRKLRAYLLGLALLAMTRPAIGFLRQGCNLVRDPDRASESLVVYTSGKREPVNIGYDAVLTFARAAASDFGVGESRTVKFDTESAKADVSHEKRKRNSKKAGKAGARKVQEA